MGVTSANNNRASRGVVLLISLSVILLLTMALTKTFENRTVEVVHLENTLQRFQAETLSRSVFRTILLAIKFKGLVFVVQGQKQILGIPIPIETVENGFFQISEIKPLDHLFNLNRKFIIDSPRETVFLNLVAKIQTGEDGPPDLIQQDLYPAMNAINDWIDSDIYPDDQYAADFEQYSQQGPVFDVKNRPFDRLSELVILSPFRELGLSKNDLETHFRVLGKTDEYININVAQMGEIESFLERYENVTGYAAVYDNRAVLDEIATTEEENDPMMLQSSVEPRFSLPLFKTGAEWGEALKAEGITLNVNEKKLFTRGKTEHLAIEYSVTVDRVTLEVKSIVRLEYQKKDSVSINKIVVLSYSMR